MSSDEQRRQLGHLITAARKAKPVSITRCASEVGIQPHTLRRYERGDTMPPWDVMVRLAEYLGVPLVFFQGVTPPVERPQVTDAPALYANFEAAYQEVLAYWRAKEEPADPGNPRRKPPAAGSTASIDAVT